jgi:hypothetical protein
MNEAINLRLMKARKNKNKNKEKYQKIKKGLNPGR